MLRVDKTKKGLVVIPPKSLRNAGYWERRDLQEMICRSTRQFCDELGESIHFVGDEVMPTDVVQDRIDLLGVDPDGAAVIVEIKRDSHKLHLLQALSYAGMIAKWTPKQFGDELRKFNSKWGLSGPQKFEDVQDELEESLEEGDIEAINRNQRIILLAEEFDYEVLVTAEWLTEKYELDIRCYRLALATNGTEDFLTCTRTYPPPELTEISVRRRRRKEIGTVGLTDWNEALKSIENPSVAAFFRRELDLGREGNVQYVALRFPIAGRRRFVAYAKRKWVRVWQNGRFDDDIQFWSERLSTPNRISALKDGKSLRLYLETDADCDRFKLAVESELLGVEFHNGIEADLGEEPADA